MTTTISLTREGRVGHVVLEGERSLNAIGSATLDDIVAAVRSLEEDGVTRAVVVRGSGRAFSAGADIRELATYPGPDQFAAFLSRFAAALDVLTASRLPIVAAINGLALGGGLELALACDVRVAADTARLGLPEVALGAIPGAGGTQRLPRLVPPGIAREMLLLGDSITAARAYEIGLVNQVVAPELLVRAATALAERLAQGPPLVHAALKFLLDATATARVGDGTALERKTAHDLFGTADGAEGRRAFAERRTPQFTGEPIHRRVGEPWT
jgi:enoyl-CoA hydratase/carnithine racemase